MTPPATLSTPRPVVQGTDVPTLERPLFVLTFFTPQQPQWSLSNLARASGLPKASCLRALRVLEKYDLLVREGDRYRLGSGFIAMKAHAQQHAPPLNVALPHLAHLAEQTGLQVSWAVLDDEQTLYTEVLPLAGSGLAPGDRRALLGDASGRLLLAFAERTLRERVFAGAAALDHAERATLDTLDSVSRRTWLSAPVARDHLEGAVQVAAPAFRAGGRLAAALALTWPAAPTTWAGAHDTVQHLVNTAQKVSRDLGYERAWVTDTTFFLQVLTRLSMPALSDLPRPE
ncbi:IclR family transcriptional regulator [Deinococcus arboris]|uniref:IclR family transcriptional regulator n=1 Tax=Deinococcus arboris TaxID=2682977 RepID=UPI0012F901BC